MSGGSTGFGGYGTKFGASPGSRLLGGK